MIDDGSRCLVRNDEAVEAFVAGIEPFVEYFCLEQRSREAGEGETRIRFARPEPTAHERERGFFSEGFALLSQTFGGKAERRAARNLLSQKADRRDVLNIQRTKLIH